MKKKLLSYEKGKFDDFVKSLPCSEQDVFSISYLTNENIALKYTGIDGKVQFVIDITVMVLSAKVRDDLRIIYEGWINALNDKNEDNIFYCVEKACLSDALDLFSYYFEAEEDSFIEEFHLEISDKGEAESKALSEYSKGQFLELINGINKGLYGHATFKFDLEEQLKAFILYHKMGSKKLFSIFLCGKSGIGKTEVGRLLQRLMYPNELPIKINFGNYSGKGSLWSLIGSPKGYEGSRQGGELTNKIKRSKSKIIIIDELDKADETIFTFFYEMLEDGQYTDLDEKLIDLDGYIVVFTANLNNENFKDKIPEPLFSRFDMTYEFEALSSEDITQFVSEYVDVLIKDYIEKIGPLDAIEIKSRIMEKNYTMINNLRNIRRDVMNDFLKLIDIDQIWNNKMADNNREKDVHSNN